MKIIIKFALLLTLLSLPAFASNAAVQGFCSIGGQKVTTSGMSSSTMVQASYPKCLVSVFNTGTSTLATIFADGSSTPLANPFTANANASWLFYAASGEGYDITLSGGVPNAFPQPFTLADVVAGGGGGGTPIPPSIPVLASNSGGTVQTANSGGVVSLFGGGTCSGFLKSDGTCGSAATVPAPAFSVPFANSGVTAFQTDNTFSFNTTNKSLQANTFVSNVFNPTLNGSINSTEVYNNTIPNLDGFLHTLIKSGTGWNYGPSANVTNSFSTFGLFFSQFIETAPGIRQFMSGTMETRSPGDTAFVYCSGCYTPGGTYGNSDEGYTAFHVNGGESLDTYSSSISAGTAQGATFINAPAQISTGGGLYTMNLSQRLEVGCITATPTLVNDEFWLETVGCGGSVTPSTAAGDIACVGGLPQLADQSIPQSITCTVNQSPSTSISPNFHTGVASLAGGFNEQVLITAVGAAGASQSVTFTYRKPNLTSWAPGGTFANFSGQLWDGVNIERAFLTPPQVSCVTGTTAPSWNPTFGGLTTDGTCTWQNSGPQANTATTLWQGGSVQGTMQIFDKDLVADSMSMAGTCYGATDSTHIVCGQTIDGEQISPNFTTLTALPLLDLAKSGTTVTATPSGAAIPFNGVASAIISGCSDSSLNGTVTNVIGGNGSIQWTQTGGGTGCPNANIDLDPAYHNQSLVPMAEQTTGQIIDSSGHNLPGINLEPNIVTFNTSNLVQQQHPPSFGGAVWWIEHNMSNPSAQGTGIKMDFTGAGAANINPIVMENTAPCAQFVGCGGTHIPFPWMQLGGGNSGIITARHSMTQNPDFNIFSPLQGINCAAPLTESLITVNADVSQYAGTFGFLPCSQTWTWSGNQSFQNTAQANIFVAGQGANPVAGISANNLGIDDPTSHTITIGDGTFNSANGALTTQEIFAPLITVGATAPFLPQVFYNGTRGTTSYSYVLVCNTINGFGPVSTTVVGTLGNAVLDSTNNNIVKGTPGGGCLSVNIYRAAVTGSYGIGLICANVSPAVIGSSVPGCLDIGQTATGSIPTPTGAGILTVDGTASARTFTGNGTGAAFSTGTASNTDTAGRLVLVGGTISRTFAGTYTTAPVCVASDTSAAAALQVATTTTTLTINTAASSTDGVAYVCMGLN